MNATTEEGYFIDNCSQISYWKQLFKALNANHGGGGKDLGMEQKCAKDTPQLDHLIP